MNKKNAVLSILFSIFLISALYFLYGITVEKYSDSYEVTLPDASESSNALHVKVPMDPNFDFMVGKVENKILHNETPNTFLLDYGDGIFETFSMRTTFWLKDEVITRISFLPLAEPLPYKKIFNHIETLFHKHYINIYDHIDSFNTQRYNAYKNSNAPDRESSFVPGIRRVRFVLSDSVNVVLEIRQGPIQGWIYTLSFTTATIYSEGNIRREK